ncbi:DUF2254 domain-containing protein [Anaerobium acetethylicum]|uniref:Uncharacterized membrane protein n=1 Tax=Anaerobium acetethylicum TaxID=1619234 RepID=A0A1D3TST9_9FIRM|nr:DUF2254 domain-containing protein [Anaerobium acetethylicum]SCP96950.1 Uncharacterized membrane protein [Anaerobium acetethylicum]
MIQKIIMLYKNKKIWVILSGYFVVALFLSILIILIDHRILPVQSYIPAILFTTVDLARQILGMLSGVLLTITTFTFSTILVVLTMYSSQFSPRVVENFLTNKITMKVLGIYVGGFFYCITNLLFLRNTDLDYQVICAAVGVIYSILCMIYFVVFVYTVSSSIQANKLIERLYDESKQTIENTISLQKDKERSRQYSFDQNDLKIELFSKKTGYLDLIDLDLIWNLIKEFEYKIFIHTGIGDFLSENQKIGVLYYRQGEIDEDFISQLSDCFTVGDERYAFNDYKFSLQKIIEISLRAISPGINDPYTAIRCIRMLGVLLGKMAGIDGCYTVIKSDESKAAIIYESVDFRKDLYYTFYQIIHYGKADISVVLALFEALEIIKRTASIYNQRVVKEFAEYIYSVCISEYEHKMDTDLIKEKMDSIREATRLS